MLHHYRWHNLKSSYTHTLLCRASCIDFLWLTCYAGGKNEANKPACTIAYITSKRVIQSSLKTITSFFSPLPLFVVFLRAIRSASQIYQIGYADEIRVIICTWKLRNVRVTRHIWGMARLRSKRFSRWHLISKFLVRRILESWPTKGLDLWLRSSAEYAEIDIITSIGVARRKSGVLGSVQYLRNPTFLHQD